MIDVSAAVLDSMLSFKITGLPQTTNANRRSSHWGTLLAESKKWKKAVWVAVISEGRPILPLSRAKVELTRYSSVEPDFDNLVSSFKWIIDGLIDAKVIVSDKPSVIGQPIYHWKKVAPKKGMVEVKVTSNEE